MIEAGEGTAGEPWCDQSVVRTRWVRRASVFSRVTRTRPSLMAWSTSVIREATRAEAVSAFSGIRA